MLACFSRKVLIPLVCIAAAAQSQSVLPKPLHAHLRTCRSASLIALDSKLTGTISALVSADALVELQLQLLPQELLKWSPESVTWIRGATGAQDRWAAIDGKGQVVAKGAEPPTAKALAEILAKVGLRSPVSILKTFLKAHPDNQEARAELLGLLHSLASSRTLKALKLNPIKRGFEEAVDATGSAWTGSGKWLPESDAHLSVEQDLLIWASLAQELETLFRDPAWVAAPIDFQGYFAEAHSPMVQAIYQRHLPRVREALVQRPRNYQLWQLWVRLQGSLPTKPVTAFMASLEPLPEALGGRGECPPSQVVGLLVADARRRKDWSAATELLMRKFEEEFPEKDSAEPEVPRALEPRVAAMRANDAAETWKNLGEPLLEGMVSLGQENRTLQIVQRVRKDHYLKNLDQRLRELAKRIARKDLAAYWVR